ncbi:MAG: MmgE/PrpD family protein [Deltaproteobacteria bacterium]|nr:MmgE/PrpD family protein [Deltaproteobacteria bacterium]
MDVIEFIHDVKWRNFPESVRRQARRCLLDTLGAAIGGSRTKLSRIIRDFAASAFGGHDAYLWFDGREVSPPGAALANGMTIDSLDIHDGHPLAKGHAGAAIVPATLATIPLNNTVQITGAELLTTMVVGYEVALRAAIALHATACDYHTSGAWNALGCAAVAARRLGLTSQKTRHALGTAEYHGPRSQMMRCIDHPTMVKDGSGWGAMAGVSAAYLARDDFTGAPALTIEDEQAKTYWDGLGQDWLISGQYFKPHAVCRWAQPAIEAALTLKQTHRLSPDEINRIEIHTFHEAVRLTVRHPQSTEEAQYSLPFPLAAALVHGRLGAAELDETALADETILQLSDRIELIEDDQFSSRFPARRFARVIVETTMGERYDSGEVEARWDPGTPPSDQALSDKFRWLAKDVMPGDRASELENLLWQCSELSDVSSLLNAILL